MEDPFSQYRLHVMLIFGSSNLSGKPIAQAEVLKDKPHFSVILLNANAFTASSYGNVS